MDKEIIRVLKKHGVFKEDVPEGFPVVTYWPMNITRDTHVGTANHIVEAMEEYADIVVKRKGT